MPIQRLLSVLAVLLTTPAATAEWPTRPITLVVTVAVGSSNDVGVQMIAPRLSQLLGQQVIVENVSGAGGMVGAARVAKAPPDGYQFVSRAPS
jgi:tripartite-type tricarboxylate transporter receptor subunit TctC